METKSKANFLRYSRISLGAVIALVGSLLLASCGAATNTLAPVQVTALPATTTVAATTTSATTTVAATTAPASTTVAATTAPASTTVASTTAPASTTVAATTAPATTSAATTAASYATTSAATTTGSTSTTSNAAVATGTPPTVTPPSGGATLSGKVFDRNNNKPLPGAIVVAGYQTIKRATIADSNGNYSFKGIPATKQLIVLSFLAGYTYLFQTIDVTDGQNAKLDFGVIVQADPNLVPTLSNYKISTTTAKPGDEVTFSMTVKMSPNSKVPLSNEIMAMNPSLNTSVLLTDTGGGNYVGKLKLPDNVAAGTYDWHFFATDEACREPAQFPVINLSVQ